MFTVSYNKKMSCWEQSGERRYPELAGVFKGIVTEPKKFSPHRYVDGRSGDISLIHISHVEFNGRKEFHQ